MVNTQIIAEVGSVHDGSFGNALKLIDVASRCAADMVKFQTHIASAETLRNAPMPPYFNGEPRYEYFERTGFSTDQWRELKSHCEANDIEFLSSAFSPEAVELLESLGVARYKVPSGEVTNLPLLEQIAETGKPVLMSSGMSSWRELEEAVNTILRKHQRLTLLQCTSEYPCPYDEVGLNVMLEMRDRFELPVGLSDHTLTPYASIAAVALGATVIERHLTFSRSMYGSDAKHSMEPDEFRDLVTGIRAVETMLKTRLDKDAASARLQHMKGIFEKSIVSLVDIEARSVITREMVGLKKPGIGIGASRLKDIVGKQAAHAIAKDTLILEEDLVL